MTLNIGGLARAERGDDFSSFGADSVGAPTRNAAAELVRRINASTSPVERSQLLGQLDAHTGDKQVTDALVRDGVTAAGAQGSSGAVNQSPGGTGISIALSDRRPVSQRVAVDASLIAGATEGGPDQTEEPGMLFQPGESNYGFSGISYRGNPNALVDAQIAQVDSVIARVNAEVANTAATGSTNPTPTPTDPTSQAVATPEPAAAADARATTQNGNATAEPSPSTTAPWEASASPSPSNAANGVATGTTVPPSIANTAENGNSVYYSGGSPLIDNKSLWYVSADWNYGGPVYTPSPADGTAAGIGPVTGGALDDGKGRNVAYSQGAPDVYFDKSGAPYIYLPHADNQGLYAVYIQPSAPPTQSSANVFSPGFMLPDYLSSVFPGSNSGQLSITNNTDGVRDYPAGAQILGQSYIRGPLTADETYNLALLRDQSDRLALAASNPFAAGALLAGSSTSSAATIGAAADGVLTGAAGAVGVSQVANADAGAIERFLPADWAELKGFPGVGTTANGGPTFANTPYLYPAGPGQQSVVSIELTGSRAGDIKLADSVSGIDSKGTGYTWHHVDNFDPIEGTSTLELVATDVHQVAGPHSGSVAQYKELNGTGYRR